MDQPRTCPQCGAELPRDAMDGLCPKCMARVVFGEGDAGEVKPEEVTSAEINVDQDSDVGIERPGTMIGRYKLLEQIGEGGFGIVYMAEQVEPVQRKVALKVIKAGMDTLEVIARFEAERQALALMDHPNIARVLDAGATEAGRPYFVMELVKGIPITEFCDQKKLSPVERLELFMKVCQAVQHAHQKGIIHRDIKPSNVLVTLHDGAPVPKVIDFGIAKALGPKLTEKTLFTGFAHLLGTPAYMSPEQAELSGLDIDTRSDIYSLGVLLYELLTGMTPFPKETLAKAALDEVRRVIREVEPPKPSTRLSEVLVAADVSRRKLAGETTEGISADSRRRLQTLIGVLRGDLDWIVMKCLEKDRTRRYETANGLAMDLQRHLSNEPVVAAAPSVAYRAQKFIRRNRVALAVAASIMLLLVAGTVVSAWQAVRATRAERHSKAEANKSQQVAQFLKDMLEGVGPSVARGRDATMLKEILDKTAERVGRDLTNQPDVEADLRNTIGEVYQALGDYPKAGAMHREVQAILSSRPVNDASRRATSLNNLGKALLAQGKPVEAERRHREALGMLRKLFGNEHVDIATTLNNLGMALHAQGKLSDAETIHREALAMYRKLLGNEHLFVATSINNLVKVLADQGRLTGADDLQRESLATTRKLLGDDHQDVAISLSILATVLQVQGKPAEAEPLFEQALAMAQKLLGNEHPEVAASLNNLATVLAIQGKPAEAEPLFREVLPMARKLLGNEHPHVARTLNNLVSVLQAQGKLGEAESGSREALEILRAQSPADELSIATTLAALVSTLLALEQFAEAEPLARECLAIREKSLPDDWRTFYTRSLLGGTLSGQKKYAEAEPLLLSGYEGMKQREEKIPASGKARLTEALQRVVQLYESWGKPEKAAEWSKKLAGGEKAPFETSPADAPRR